MGNKDKKIKIIVLLIGLWLVPGWAPAQGELKMELKKTTDLGRGDFFFASIEAVCEDREGNIFVLDRKAYKVYRFSPAGRLLLSFGSKGQGPGDFSAPNSLFITENNELAVCDDMTYVSIFDLKGRFLRRLQVPRGLGLAMIGPDRFYAWQWTEKGRQQIIVDSGGRVIDTFFEVFKEDFSVSAPDETGRLVMSNYSCEAYTPTLLFCHFQKHTALALNSRYRIILLDDKGKRLKDIGRDIKPLLVTGKCLYTVTEEDESLILTRYTYTLTQHP